MTTTPENDPPEVSTNDVAAQDDAEVADDQTPEVVPGDADDSTEDGDDLDGDDGAVWPPEPTEPARGVGVHRPAETTEPAGE